VHTGTRILTVLGLVERVPRSGDRRSCFRLSPRAWERTFEAILEHCRKGVLLARAGMEAVAPDNPAARIRLEEMMRLAEFVEGETLATSAEWTRRQARRREGI
jgi:hypothetical protein